MLNNPPPSPPLDPELGTGSRTELNHHHKVQSDYRLAYMKLHEVKARKGMEPMHECAYFMSFEVWLCTYGLHNHMQVAHPTIATILRSWGGGASSSVFNCGMLCAHSKLLNPAFSGSPKQGENKNWLHNPSPGP